MVRAEVSPASPASPALLAVAPLMVTPQLAMPPVMTPPVAMPPAVTLLLAMPPVMPLVVLPLPAMPLAASKPTPEPTHPIPTTRPRMGRGPARILFASFSYSWF